MNNKEEELGHNQPPAVGETGGAEASSPNLETPEGNGRRRFVKGVLAATPVIMSVASRPAWGIGGGNFCWSGLQSGNLSGHDHNACCFGRSPGYYKSNVSAYGDGPGWPPGFLHGCPDVKSNGTIDATCKTLFKDPEAGIIDGTQFSSVFPSGSIEYDGLTLMQVLWQKSGSFGFHAIAAYFNSLNFQGCYTWGPDELREIIIDILTLGHHTDGDMMWTEDQMKCLFDASYHTDPHHDTHVPGCF